jgi:hypothetical protein
MYESINEVRALLIQSLPQSTASEHAALGTKALSDDLFWGRTLHIRTMTDFVEDTSMVGRQLAEKTAKVTSNSTVL